MRQHPHHLFTATPTREGLHLGQSHLKAESTPRGAANGAMKYRGRMPLVNDTHLALGPSCAPATEAGLVFA